MATDDELYSQAFLELSEVSERMKAEGLEPAEVWALLFTVMQDLQAADFGIGSPAHEEALVLQRDRLAEDIAELRDDAPLVQ